MRKVDRNTAVKTMALQIRDMVFSCNNIDTMFANLPFM